jgi:DNA recombination protein RmuC
MTISYIVFFIVLIISLLLVVAMIRLSGIKNRVDQFETDRERLERLLREEMARNREESSSNNKQTREEMSGSLRDFSEAQLKRMMDIGSMQKSQLDIFSEQLKNMTQVSEQKLEKLREAVEAKLQQIQEENSQKLEQMRATVDEKLHETMEKRLGESFKLVSERLELVHKGLGEMQTLAAGVGDLKKTLANVKTRGILGEIQLGNLLEQILIPEQYERNVITKKGGNARVEFAIKLPGRSAATDGTIWLPIDAKFPQEDYLRLLEAQERGNPAQVEEASKQLERIIKEMAKNIRDKYLDPPYTTDFGIMFLPMEGLYAEVLRRTGLFELLQREYRVSVTGPTTLAALLNSLQMGFRTLAIEKRSSEVWTILGAVKTDFASFGEILDRTLKKLQEAGNNIENAVRRSRGIEKKLKTVQEIPPVEAQKLLGRAEMNDTEESVEALQEEQ